jgi:hypothetical protein
MFLNSFNHFRALAILSIVMGHTYLYVGMKFDTYPEYVVMNLILGGTSLFVFISGFLFHHVFYKKYQFNTFVLGKFKNVAVPYILLGVMPIFLQILYKSDAFDGYFAPTSDGLWGAYIIPYIKYYWTGRFLIGYWYIPFILVTFLLSPLHVKFIRMPPKLQVALIGILSVVSVLMHRPEDNLFVFQSVLYFTPIYLLGIFCSVYKEQVLAFFQNKVLLLFSIVLFFALVEAYQGEVGSYHKAPLPNGYIDYMFIQKMCMCFLLMTIFARLESWKNKLVEYSASTSFTIFFLHPLVMTCCNVLTSKYLGFSLYLDSWLVYILYTVFILLMCIAIAKTVKYLIPNQSRYLIGY